MLARCTDSTEVMKAEYELKIITVNKSEITIMICSVQCLGRIILPEKS